MVLVATLAKQQALMKKAKQTHKQNRSRTYVHVRAWICIAIGHPRPMAIIHLSLYPLRRRRQIDKDILAAKQALFTGPIIITWRMLLRAGCRRICTVCMPVTATATHCHWGGEGSGGGGWGEERTDEEPVQVANWHGSVQSIHRTSHLMAAMADYTAYFLPHVEKKRPCFNSGLLYLPLPLPPITLSVTHHHHHRREEKRRVHVRPAAHAFPWK